MINKCRIGILLLALAFPAFTQTDDFIINQGMTYDGNVVRTSGDVIIFQNARLTGSCNTGSGDVNVLPYGRVDGQITTNSGYVTIGSGGRAQNIQTTSGNIIIEAGAIISGTLQSTTGSITIHADATVSGEVRTPYGDIIVDGGRVNDDLVTQEGFIQINNEAFIQDNVRVLNRGSGTHGQIVIYLGNCSRVGGDVESALTANNVLIDFYCGRVDGELVKVDTQGPIWTTTGGGGYDCSNLDEWATNVRYDSGDLVQYENVAYLCTGNNVRNKRPDLFPQFWSIQGDCSGGDSCAGLDEWEQWDRYYSGDEVQYEDRAYTCTGNNIRNKQPDLFPQFWDYDGDCGGGGSETCSTCND